MRKKKSLLTIVLVVALACSSLTACTGTKNETAAKSRAQDTIIYAQSADPRGLDPALVDDGLSANVMVNVYEGLLKYNKDSTKVEPSLAESWDISSDGLTYTFYLKKGVKFQDGTDFNAAAVKFNIDRQLPPKVTEDMPYSSFVFGSVKDVEVVDDYTVKINMKSASTPFLTNLAMCLGAPIVSPKALQDNSNNVNEHPVGTGPYTFVSWTKSQNVVLKRNDNYWGDKAVTQNIIFKFISDNSARVVALNNGEADIIEGIDATVVKQIEDAGNKISDAQGMNINYMAYNTTKAPFDKVEVRTAISQAINVPELVKSLYQGYAEPATSVLPTFMQGYDTSIKQVAFDQAAAKAALTAAGITSLHIITYTNARPYNTANGQALAEAVQGYLKNAGVTATIDAFDWTTYKQKVVAGDYDICFYGWTGDNGDPDNFMSLMSDKDPAMNVARFDNADYKALISKGLTTSAGDARNKVYTDLEKMAATEAVWLPISHAKTLVGYRSNVKDFNYHMTGVVFLSRATKN
ncbi:MAG: ABC transporter substrate-binding protein [Ruminiclostridium sp.]